MTQESLRVKYKRVSDLEKGNMLIEQLKRKKRLRSAEPETRKGELQRHKNRDSEARLQRNILAT